MRLTFFIVFLSLLSINQNVMAQSFKQEQLTKSRVKSAQNKKQNLITSLLDSVSLSANKLNVYLRAFKHEEILEVWVKHKDSLVYQLLKEYKICYSSGNLGPKTQEGDLQVPEGFYHIDRFNPTSIFHLSLGINYPNASDKKRLSGQLGGDIFIHGDCVSVGCLPLTDDKIKEVYLLCIEAKNNGQRKIPVHIYPFKMGKDNWSKVQSINLDSTLIHFWTSIKPGYDIFEKQKKLPLIKTASNGLYEIE